MNLADTITEHARLRPEHPAIEDGDRSFSYAEFDARVRDSATNLRAAGIRPGDVVAVMLPNSAEHLFVIYGLLRLGATVMPTEARLRQDDIHRITQSTAIKALVTDAAEAKLGNAPTVTVDAICARRTAPERNDDLPASGTDLPALRFNSSGTTGAPKSFLWSHAHGQAVAARYLKSALVAPTDRYLVIIGLSFPFGIELCLSVLQAGATVVIAGIGSLDGLPAVAQERRITLLCLTPAHLRRLLGRGDAATPLFPYLRALLTSTAPLTAGERAAVRRQLAPGLFDIYGSNEIGIVTVAAPADQDLHPDSIGPLCDDVEAQVFDGDGRPMPAGEIGLIGFRAPCFPTGYIANPEQTGRFFRDGWFYPGDLASLNADGYVFLKGRADDVISNEGVKFYPVDVETALLAHPAVAEAAAFGWPHERFGECAVAAVVTRAPVEGAELTTFCRGRLAGYKVPKMILFLPELPKNTMGKIVKARLKEMLRGELAKQRG